MKLRRPDKDDSGKVHKLLDVYVSICGLKHLRRRAVNALPMDESEMRVSTKSLSAMIQVSICRTLVT